MERRNFLKLTSAFAAVSLSSTNFRSVFAKEVSKSATSKILTLSDGSLRLPPSFALPDVPKAELESVLGELPNENSLIERPLNLTLLKTENRTVLFDVGSGPNFMPSAGKLNESLDAMNVAPEDVTDVVFTHGHPDHLWGILDDFDEVWFPEAQLHFPKIEFDFWLNDGTINTMPEERKVFAVGAKNRLEAISDQINLFNDGAEVVSGVEAMSTYGHTPGHTSFVIHAADEPVMVIGDALTHDILSFQKPEWPAGGDQDRDMAAATRKKLLDRLAHEQMQLVGYHLTDNGIGRVESSGTAYRFIPS